MKTISKLLGAIFLTQLPCVGLIAQTPIPARAYKAAMIGISIGSGTGRLMATPADTPSAGQMAQVAAFIDSASNTLSVTLPFEYVGGIASLTDRHFVISGTDTLDPPTGHLVRIEIDAGFSSITVHETQTYPGKDFFDIAWSPSYPLLSAIDGKTKTFDISAFPWPVTPPSTPVLPTGFSPALTQTQCGALASDYASLGSDSSVYLIRANRMANPFKILLNGSSWVVTSPTNNYANEWRVDDKDSHSGNLRVRSEAAALGNDLTFNVINKVTATIVASGAITALGDWVSIPSPTSFYEYPGYPHEIVGALSGDSREFYPMVRYGAGSTGVDIEMGRAHLFPGTVYVGSTGALASCGSWIPSIPDDGDGLPQPMSLGGFLLVGLGQRGVGAGPDPIVGTGSNARLQFVDAYGVGVQRVYHGDYLGTSINIPDLAFLSDYVLLTQWAMVDPGNSQDLIYSDIVAARIRPTAQTALASGGGGPNTQTASALSPSRAREQFREATRLAPRRVSPRSSTAPASLWKHRQQ